MWGGSISIHGVNEMGWEEDLKGWWRSLISMRKTGQGEENCARAPGELQGEAQNTGFQDLNWQSNSP